MEPNCVIDKDVKIVFTVFMSDVQPKYIGWVGVMPWPQTGATHCHAQ